jgi:glycosyltransferase involved in cell wall biosynthesis
MTPMPVVRLDGVRLAVFSDTYPPQMNGVSRTLERLVEAARDRGAEVRVFTSDDPNVTQVQPDIIRWASIAFWAYPQVRLAAPRTFAARAALEAWQPSLVHVATEFGVGLAGRSAATSLHVPMVTSYHTSFSGVLPPRRAGGRGMEVLPLVPFGRRTNLRANRRHQGRGGGAWLPQCRGVGTRRGR